MVTIPRAIYDDMVAHVTADWPNEGCGVLAADGQGAIVAHYPARNVAEEPRTFSIISPAEQLQIYNAIDAQDWTIYSYYHSHPETEAYPSVRDVLYAQGWPDTVSLIFTLRDPAHPVLRAYHIVGETITEDDVTIA